MKQFDIKEYNKMCAEFLGGTEYIPKPWYYFPRYQRHWFFPNRLEPNRFTSKMLKFHTDWNWIMEVVEKIESLDDSEKHYQWKDVNNTNRSNFNGYSVDIEGNDCLIWLGLELDPLECLAKSKGKTKKEAVVTAIWEFLNWYKTQTT